jgi:hypothetical protein
MLRHRLRLAALALTGLAMFAGVTGASAAQGVAPNATAAASGCNVMYAIQSDWGAGFVVNITVTNLGAPITAWTLGFSYTGNQALASGWNGTWTQSGKAIAVTNAAYNGSLATGGTASPGAQFSYSGTNTAPTAFTLNGVACNQPTQPAPAVAITSPTAGQVFTPGANIPLAATAASTGSGTIASVMFLESTGTTSNTVIGTVLASPYTLTWTAVPRIRWR